MKENIAVGLLAMAAKIKADDIAASDLGKLSEESAFPVSGSVRRGRAALIDRIESQVVELRRRGGLLFLIWSAQ